MFLAAKLAAAPTKGVAVTKVAIRAAFGRSIDQALDGERDAQRTLGATADYGGGVASFLE